MMLDSYYVSLRVPEQASDRRSRSITTRSLSGNRVMKKSVVVGQDLTTSSPGTHTSLFLILLTFDPTPEPQKSATRRIPYLNAYPFGCRVHVFLLRINGRNNSAGNDDDSQEPVNR